MSFTRIEKFLDFSDKKIKIYINNSAFSVPEKVSVSAALLMHNFLIHRKNPISNNLRSPYCMMGVCFECLVEIDSIPNCQACLVEVYENIKIKINSKQEGSDEAVI